MTAVLSPALEKRKRRLLTVGHSYVIRASRRLPEAIQEASNGEWDVTIAAPSFYRGNPRFGDLRPEVLRIAPDETVPVVGIPVALTGRVHFALYGLQLRSLMASGFDAIHCWEEPFILSGAQMAQWAPRDSVLTYTTWQNIKKSYPPPFNLLERRTISRCDGWIAGGHLCENALRDRARYRDRPHRVIGFGIDTKTFRPDPEAGARIRAGLGWVSNDVPVVGFVGRFTEAKGLPLLLKCLDALQTPWRALFVGDGSLDGSLRRWALPYGPQVSIVSSVSNEQIPDYLNAIDVLCVPSQTTPTWHEQFGRVLIEAFACGVCVLASDSGEIPHVVAEAGRIVGERDEAGWRTELETLLTNTALCRDLAGRGLKRVHEQYTWLAVGAKYLEFFDSLQRSKRPMSIGRR